MKKTFLLQVFFLLTLVGCHRSVPIEEQCPLPEFLIGSKKLRLNMSLDDVPEKDSLRRLNLPGVFNFDSIFDNDGLYETVVYNEIKPTVGMTTHASIKNGIIKYISIDTYFHPDTDKECFQILDFFTQRLSEHYHTTPKKRDTISYHGGTNEYTDRIPICNNYICVISLDILGYKGCKISVVFYDPNRN